MIPTMNKTRLQKKIAITLYNQCIFFRGTTLFPKPIRYLFWFQYILIETILLSEQDFGPIMLKNEVSKFFEKLKGF